MVDNICDCTCENQMSTFHSVLLTNYKYFVAQKHCPLGDYVVKLRP